MKRFSLFISAVLLAVSSCGRNGLYISVDNTTWEYMKGNQKAWVSFLDDERVSLIAVNYETDAYQTFSGLFDVDGHRVNITSGTGSSVKMIRTFSHLKNSSNKNYWTKKPAAPDNLPGSVWACLLDDDFLVTYFRGDGTCVEGVFENASHKEGVEYGWKWDTAPYSAEGYGFVSGDSNGTFYGEFLHLDSVIIPRVNSVTAMDGSSSLKGTAWVYDTSGFPGLLIFTSARDFIRIQVSSAAVFSVLEGTYALKGNSLEFVTDSEELNKTCTVSDGQFTYLEKTYSLVHSF